MTRRRLGEPCEGEGAVWKGGRARRSSQELMGEGRVCGRARARRRIEVERGVSDREPAQGSNWFARSVRFDGSGCPSVGRGP